MSSSTPDPKRNRRDRRPSHPRSMRETVRDRHIVKLVYDYRILSQEQVERALGKSRSTVQQSLIRLYHHQYLERVFLPISYFGSSPTLYILGRRGIELLQRMGIDDFTGVPSKDLSVLFLAHTLAINEFRLAITQAARVLDWSIPAWRTENEIKAGYDHVSIQTASGRVERVPVVPDSYFVVDIPDRGTAPCLLELDRGSMTVKKFRTKVLGYVAYYRNGGYEKRYHSPAFRVLTVVDGVGKGRLASLLTETAGVPGIGRRFWFTHIKDVTTHNPLIDPIWQIAGADGTVALFNRSNE